MNKTAIKNFAIWARVQLIEAAKQRAYEYEITEKGENKPGLDMISGRLLSADEKKQRQQLISQINAKGYTQVMEEAAYTWFNRFIALRFMEVNGFLPSKVRVFTDENGTFKPEVLKEAMTVEIEGLDRSVVLDLLDKQNNEELYKYLLITQCNALNQGLPYMFEKISNWTELLFPANLLRSDSILGHMVTDIPEEDWTDQVQIIGWLYQYYNSELKDDTFALLKKNVKITKERIPSATQLFTPDWIVRYMVENSLGRIFIDKRKNEGVFADGRGADEMTWEETEAKRIANEKYIADQMGWKYYLPEAEQTEEVRQQLDEIQRENANLDVKEIKVIDPCMGSGHILVYAFDVLMQIYEANGYSQRDAAQSILENNLYGLDIDDRAAQLAYFAVMMKARQYDRRIFSRGIQPHVYAIVESNGLDSNSVEYFTNNDPKLQKDFGTLMDELRDAKEYGSILNISQVDFAALFARIDEVRDDISIFREVVLSGYLPLIQVAEVMAQKYDVVVTNPPYMGGGNMSAKLSDFVKKKYPDSKSDLFACFIEHGNQMVALNGYNCMVTMQSWMFLSSFEKMRSRLLSSKTITNLMHMENMVMGIAFGTAVTVFKNSSCAKYRGTYNHITLQDISNGKPREFPVKENRYAQVSTSNFSKIPGTPVAYWVSESVPAIYSNNPTLEKIADVRHGLSTGKNELFVRRWEEVDWSKIDFSITNRTQIASSPAKWFPYNKGGDYRLWYGNADYVLWYNTDGQLKMASMSGHRHDGKDRYFQESISWSFISSSNFGVRYTPTGFAFDVAGSSMFLDNEIIKYITGLLCSCLGTFFMEIQNPTLNFQVGNLKNVPVIVKDKNRVDSIVNDAIKLSKGDWDSYETSWDFKRNPLASSTQALREQMASQFATPRMEKFGQISWHYENWKQECEDRFQQLKANEEELNRIFIDIYGLQDELTPDVADKDVTVHRVFDSKDDVPESMKGSNYVRTMRDEIVSLISYAVGCMFGRYSLDEPGLAYAGGEWDASKYSTIMPDKDNIIPICDDDYFDDDITGRFVKWVETVYGSDTLEENLKFIADALGGKGTPREVIRNYLLNDFYTDHLKIYQKRPIYWQFSSGKKNGFKALIYMHRYQPDLLARMRTDYVHEQQERYRTQITMLEDAAASAAPSDKVKLNKKIAKLKDQALEIAQFEEKIHHLADQMTSIDLDDGVKANYAKFADILEKIK